jgi:hypothetical protein
MAKWSTTHNRVLAALAGAVLGLVGGGDARATGAEPHYLTEAQQMAALPARAILEASLVADIDGDGHPDTAILGGTPEQRRLVVWFGKQDGHESPVSAPLGAPNSNTGASLGTDQGELVVLDATGDDAETKTIYRFRRTPGVAGMRLASIESERYRGGEAIRLAWNLITGAHEFARGKLVDSADGEESVPRYGTPRRSRRESPPLDMAGTPLPDALIDAEPRAPEAGRD